MGSTWFGLNTARSALEANQLALDTAAHNAANASTPGYSRQRVNLVESPPFTMPSFNKSGLPGQIGTGVTVASITRARDAFLDYQTRGQIALGGYWQTTSDQLSKVESLFPEPSGSGLGDVLGKFWNAWQDLAADPTSSAARAVLVEQAGTLTARLNSDAGQVQTLIDGADFQVNQLVIQVNDLTTRIAALNGQIHGVMISGDHPNDLQDQRDLLLDQLNKIVPVTTVAEADGTVTVLAAGTDLVTNDRARAIGTAPDAAGHLVPVWSDASAVSLGKGQLGALLNVRDTTMTGYLGQIDMLAKGVADAVNAVHVTGTDSYGVAGLPFFTYTAGKEASTIAVNAAIVADPRTIAAASAANQPGDGSIAGAIADLRLGKIFAAGTQTAGDFYAGFIATIGSDTKQANEMSTNQNLVVAHLQTQQQSYSGVSLDEEATDMLRFQRAYQAAARVITTVDEMLDTLINRTGIVGR
jgi:flagellar hook-associated protein 1 FlgK